MPQLKAVTDAFRSIDSEGRIHMHVAEQQKEVDDCIAYCGKRPIEWLLDEVAIDKRWCLVHATHMDQSEVLRLSATGAVAGLCPITEANLGDGIFPSSEWRDAGGGVGIGTDSNILVSVTEELRWYEYAQRLRHERRNVLGQPGESTGETIYRDCLAGGAQALALGAVGFIVGAKADWITLDRSGPLMQARPNDSWIDTWIFASDRSLIRDVVVCGKAVLRDGHHANEAEIEARAADVLRRNI